MSPTRYHYRGEGDTRYLLGRYRVGRKFTYPDGMVCAVQTVDVDEQGRVRMINVRCDDGLFGHLHPNDAERVLLPLESGEP